MRTFAVVASLGLFVVVGSCGGGGGGGGGTQPVTVMLSSDATLDGWVDFRGNVDNGGAADVGDHDFLDAGLVMPVPDGVRGFWSFDISSIPAGATIVSASFTVHQLAVNGGPYVFHGVVTLDHLDYGSSLDSGDYGLAALVPAFATLSSNATIGPKGPVDVTAEVQADRVAARTRTQLRAYFSILESNNNAAPDHADFATGNSVTGNPILTVTYQP